MNKLSRGISALLLHCCFFAAGSAMAEYDAAGVYQVRCAACHGTVGQGTKAPPLGPALRGNALVLNAPAEVIATVIRKGRSGQERAYNDAYPNMPAFSPVSVTDVEALVEYLKGGLQN